MPSFLRAFTLYVHRSIVPILREKFLRNFKSIFFQNFSHLLRFFNHKFWVVSFHFFYNYMIRNLFFLDYKDQIFVISRTSRLCWLLILVCCHFLAGWFKENIAFIIKNVNEKTVPEGTVFVYATLVISITTTLDTLAQ